MALMAPNDTDGFRSFFVVCRRGLPTCKTMERRSVITQGLSHRHKSKGCLVVLSWAIIRGHLNFATVHKDQWAGVWKRVGHGLVVLVAGAFVVTRKIIVAEQRLLPAHLLQELTPDRFIQCLRLVYMVLDVVESLALFHIHHLLIGGGGGGG